MTVRRRPTKKAHVRGKEESFEGLCCSRSPVSKMSPETSSYLIPQELLSKAIGVAAKAQMSNTTTTTTKQKPPQKTQYRNCSLGLSILLE